MATENDALRGRVGLYLLRRYLRKWSGRTWATKGCAFAVGGPSQFAQGNQSCRPQLVPLQLPKICGYFSGPAAGGNRNSGVLGVQYQIDAGNLDRKRHSCL